MVQALQTTRYITMAQLQDKLGGRARSSIYIDVDAGRIPEPKKLGGRLYWNEAQIDALMNATDQLEAA